MFNNCLIFAALLHLNKTDVREHVFKLLHKAHQKKVTNGLLKPERNPAFVRCSSHLWVNEDKVSRVTYQISPEIAAYAH